MQDRRSRDNPWIEIGDSKLKSIRCYQNLPPLDLKHSVHFAACTYGGPIALAFSSSTTTTWFVQLRMSGGLILKDRIEFPDVFTIEWTRDQKLLVIDRRANAAVFTAIGERHSEFHFNSSIREVRDVRVFPTTHDSGVAILDGQLRIFVVNSVNEPISWSMQLPCKEAPTAWTAFQPPKEVTRVVAVFGRDFYIGCQGDQLTIADTVWALSDGQYARITPCSTRRNLALYHSSGVVQIVAANLNNEVSRIDVPGQFSLYRLDWIGDDCLFLQTTPTHLFILDVRDPNAYYEHHSELCRIGVEHDGIKLFYNSSMEFLSVVSKEEREVLGVATSADGALLHEASEFLVQGLSHQAYEYASQVRDLPTAINCCTKVAALSWEPEMQKSLLRAARFGLAFVSTFDTNEFVQVLRELRVLNALRSSRIGMPITYQQYQKMGATYVVNRLIDMACYGTAVEVCKWLGDVQDGVDRVLLEWVRRTIVAAASTNNVSDAELEMIEQKISRKLVQHPHVSVADVAKRAIDAKLPKLARLLIRNESDDSKQIQVLLQLDDVQEALNRAASSKRPQLMHQVVRHLMEKQKRPEYELIIRRIPMAQCVYQDIIRQDAGRGAGRQMLALLEQASDFERQTMFHLDTANHEINSEERLNALRRAKDCAQRIGDKAVAELMADLASFAPGQMERGEDRDRLSIRDTVINFAHNPQKVAQFKHQYKLSDKQIWLWTIEGLAKANRMEQLFEFAQKKSPVGYVPFIKSCVKYNKIEEAKIYFVKVNGYAEIINAHLAMGNFVSAAKMAFDRHDLDMLQTIYAKSHRNKEAYSAIGQLVRKL